MALHEQVILLFKNSEIIFITLLVWIEVNHSVHCFALANKIYGYLSYRKIKLITNFCAIGF